MNKDRNVKEKTRKNEAKMSIRLPRYYYNRQTLARKTSNIIFREIYCY
ncbi:hypothetical protein [Salipaludibacillus sp. CF4.18]